MLGFNRPEIAERVRLGIVMVFLAGCLLMGGGSRVDILSLSVLYPLAVLSIAAVLVVPGPLRLDELRTPLVGLTALAAVIAFQLVPLAPDIWTALPGRETVLGPIRAAQPEPGWHPLSVSPDLTLASLVALLVPAAALVGFAALPREQTYRLAPFLLAAVALSVLVALLQITGGDNSPFYTYRITNRGGAVGLFANRNHQALFLASAFPLLALWATRPGGDPQRVQMRRLLAASAGVFLLPMLAVTGSRAGLVLGVLGLAFAWYQFRTGRSDPPAAEGHRPIRRGVWILAAVAGVVALGSAILLSRAEAVDRLMATSLNDELRLQYLPVVLRIAGDFFPFGTGFGSFDGMFRIYEPLELLQAQYFNHAHNDLVELAMTGGLPALVVLGAFLIWLTRRGVAILRDKSRGRRAQFGRFGLGQIVLILVASLFDSPLRTPSMGALFVLACGWVAAHRQTP